MGQFVGKEVGQALKVPRIGQGVKFFTGVIFRKNYARKN